MDQIAFVIDGTYVSCSSVLLTLAAAAAICFFLAFYLHQSGNAAAGFTVVPLAIVLSLVLARFFHWYCRSDAYSGFLHAMTDYTSGGYALMGVFLGCFLAAWLVRLVRLSGSLPEMLDAMSIAGAAGICIGRLASFFNSSDRGQILENFQFLPFAYPVTNVVSGATEYRLATFVFQSLVALVLFLSLTRFYLKHSGHTKHGDTCLIFLLCYGASQVVLDSTRYDSLFFRSNGFVSIVQVLGAVALVSTITVFSRRMVKNGGFRIWYLLIWFAIAAAMGGAGYMEYYVQRHGSAALFAYSVMTLCLLFVVALTLLIRRISVKIHGKNRNFVG